MITIPLINKVFKRNTVDNKAKRKLNAQAKEIEAMSKDPKWLAYIQKHKDK